MLCMAERRRLRWRVFIDELTRLSGSVAESVDAPDLKSVAFLGVRVQVSPLPPFFQASFMKETQPGPRSAGLRFKEGDRIMHKPAIRMGVGAPLPPRIKLGTVTKSFYQTNRRGHRMPYVEIQWDNSSAKPEVVMAHRVNPATDLADDPTS